MAGAKEYLPGAKTTDAGSFQEAPARLHFDRERLGHVCRERRVARLDLFGSARRPSCPSRLCVLASRPETLGEPALVALAGDGAQPCGVLGPVERGQRLPETASAVL